jgi:hypothetical protein
VKIGIITLISRHFAATSHDWSLKTKDRIAAMGLSAEFLPTSQIATDNVNFLLQKFIF